MPTTSNDLLGTLIPEWQSLLQRWALDGALAAAAQEALLLSGTPPALENLITQWGSGDFRSLPPIVLLPSADISGAMGAYAISTGTIYLNADWLAGASKDQVFAVLTEELGHHLDGILNAADTPGDEGEYLAALLSGQALTDTQKALMRNQSDSAIAHDAGIVIASERASTPIIRANSAYIGFIANNWIDSAAKAESIYGGSLVTISNAGEDVFVRDSFQAVTRRSLLPGAADTSFNRQVSQAYIGISSGIETGQFAWHLESGEAYDYYNWGVWAGSAQPHPSYGPPFGTRIRFSVDQLARDAIANGITVAFHVEFQVVNTTRSETYIQTGDWLINQNDLDLNLDSSGYFEWGNTYHAFNGVLFGDTFTLQPLGGYWSTYDQQGNKISETQLLDLQLPGAPTLYWDSSLRFQGKMWLDSPWSFARDGAWESVNENENIVANDGLGEWGIAEVPLQLSITRTGAVKEGSGVFTTSINLSAGTQTSGNLAEGAQVWWNVTGITQEDLGSGALMGSGFITNGKLDLQHSLRVDGDLGENFEISVFSDASMTSEYQIGTMNSAVVEEADLAIRGNSLYKIVDGPTWTQAEANSVALGGHLAAVTSIEEDDFLYASFDDPRRLDLAQFPAGVFYIGFTDADQEGTWIWSSGETSTFTNWNSTSPDNYLNSDYALWGYYNSIDIRGWDDTTDGVLSPGIGAPYPGIAEIPIISSITRTGTVREGAGVFTTSINLTAGTQTSGNLAEGSTVYWKIYGITADDLASGALTGSGTITNGKLDIQHSLVIDSDTEEQFSVFVFSDAGTTQQIGSTNTVGVQESSPVIRGNSIYYIVGGPTWTQAEANAVALGGHLVTISDGSENSYLVQKYASPPFTQADIDNWVPGGRFDIQFWIGLTDSETEGQWRWMSGENSTFRNWGPGEPDENPTAPIRGGEDYAIFLLYQNNFRSPGQWGDVSNVTSGSGLAEIPIISSITRIGTAKEGAGFFTTSINLTAGTETSGNLAEGVTVYWKIDGITADDLAAGALTGSGVITNGKLDFQHSLVIDADTGENFVVSVYSDASMTSEYQIGSTQSAAITEKVTVRGNSFYTIVDGSTWTQAEANAVALGGNLVTINDASENDYLLTGQNRAINALSGDGFFWLGIQDTDNNGTYTWSSGQQTEYASWFANEPSGTDVFGQENYGFTINLLDGDPSVAQNGYWYDTTLNGNGFIPKGIAEIPFIRRGNSAYVIVQGPTWEEAEANAVKLGGHLVTINDEAENTWITNTYADVTDLLWIGLSDKTVEGVWEWSNNEKSTYENWNHNINPIEPNGGSGENYACLHTGSSWLSARGGWADIANTYRQGGLYGLAEIIIPANNAPTGDAFIVGTPVVGSTLNINATEIGDADNIMGYVPTYQYSWEVSTDGITWTNLISADATDGNSTYTLTSAEIGKEIQGVVRYLDGNGTNELVVTNPSAVVGSEFSNYIDPVSGALVENEKYYVDILPLVGGANPFGVTNGDPILDYPQASTEYAGMWSFTPNAIVSTFVNRRTDPSVNPVGRQEYVVYRWVLIGSFQYSQNGEISGRLDSILVGSSYSDSAFLPLIGTAYDATLVPAPIPDYVEGSTLSLSFESVADLRSKLDLLAQVDSSQSLINQWSWTQGDDRSILSSYGADAFFPDEFWTQYRNRAPDQTPNNNLLINGPGAGTIDGSPFTNTFVIDLGIGSDTATLSSAAGATTQMSINGGDGIDTFYGNENNNVLVIAGINKGTLDGVAFSGFENVDLKTGDDVVYIRPGGQLAGLLNGGGYLGKVVYLPPGVNPPSDGGGTPTPPPVTPPSGPPIVLPPIQPPGVIVDGGYNQFILNDNANSVILTGLGSGMVDGTNFVNFYSIDLKGGNDTATIATGGSLPGALLGDDGTDILNLNGGANSVSIDQTLSGTAAGTTIAGFELINLLDGDDTALFAINSTASAASGARQSLTLDGGTGTDALSLNLTKAELDLLRSAGTLSAFTAYLSNPTGNSITLALSSLDLTLTGFESTSLSLADGELPALDPASLSLQFLDTAFSAALPNGSTGAIAITNAAELNGLIPVSYGPASTNGLYGTLAVSSGGQTTYTGNGTAIQNQSTSTLSDTFQVSATDGITTKTADYTVSIANPSAENTLLITATGSGSIDGISFGSTATTGAYAGTLLNSINLGSGADTASLIDSAGTTAALTLNGGSGFDRLNGNASANNLTLTGLDQGTLDQVSFSSIENIYLEGGNDTVTIQAGGRLSGILDGGAGSNTLIVDGSYTIGIGSGGTIIVDNGSGGGGSFSGFQTIQGGGDNAGGSGGGGGSGAPQINTLSLNGNSNVVAITGPNSGTADGTAFTNISDVNLAAGDDNAILAAVGSLTGTLSGGSGTDDLTLNAAANTVVLSQSGAGTATSSGNGASTGFDGFEVIRLDGGNDTADLDLNGTTALTTKRQLRLDGGNGTDQITLRLNSQERQNLIATAQLAALQAFISNPNGQTLNLSLLEVDLVLTNFESAALITANQAPTDLTLTSSGIAENSPAGTLIGTLAATDPDSGSSFTYDLVAGDGSNDADNSLVEIVNGNEVRVKGGGVIDFESNPILQLNIQVTDNGTPGLSHTKAVTVNVLNQQEAGSLGAITSSTAGVFQEGVTLSAGLLSDPDTITSTPIYTWYLGATAVQSSSSNTYVVGPRGEGTYRVEASYTDGTGSSVTASSANQLVSKIDNAQGTLSAITGSGAYTEGVTLTAGTVSGDPDGTATDPAYAYQWYLNGSTIGGATNSTYAVGAQGTGTYKVAVTYTDGQGYSTTLTSADQVVAKIDNAQGTLSVITGSGAFTEGVTLSAGTVSGDPDGTAIDPAYAYQWYLNGSTIGGATNSTYAVGAQGTGTYKVAVTYTDGQGYSTTLTSADQVVAKIDNAQGTLSVITGSGAFTEGVTLSAGTVSGDPDGTAIDPAYAYQWYLNGSTIGGATNSTYAVGAQGTGTYKVAVTYTDGQGYSTTLTSADQVVTKIDNAQGTLSAITGSGAYTEGVTLTAGTVSGDPDGTATDPAYAYQWFRNGSSISGANGVNYQVPTGGAGSYTVQVSYTDGQGYSTTLTSAAQSVTAPPPPQDSTAPTLGSIAVQGTTVILQFSEAVTATSVPLTAFAVATLDSRNRVTNRTISAVTLDQNNTSRVILNLSGTAPASNVNLRVSYTDPAGNQTTGVVQDSAGNDLATVSNRFADTFLTSSTSTLASQYQNLTLSGTSNSSGTGNALANTITGNSGANTLSALAGNDTLLGEGGNDTLIGGTGADLLTGGAGTDTFRFALADSLLGTATNPGYDRITDLVIGSDRIDGPAAVTAANVRELGAVTALTQAGIAAVLTSSTFTANGAATFSYVDGGNSRTFLALNDRTAGFSSATDAVIEITGYSGMLSNLAIV
ncbi:cadherin domain-containing protein [Synechococcus sp. FGCU-3]|nr:cadherin domain-containing protein [Synechococcus sp. FGCU3]